MERRTFLKQVFLGGASMMCGSDRSQASQQFTKPLRIIVPFPPGGVMDAAGRVIAQKLSLRVGQPVVVENKSGASGMIAASFVAQSDPDGHTLLVMTSSIFLAVLLSKDPPVRISDLLPITQLFDVGIGFAVASSLGVNDFAGFLKLAKEQPGKLSYGSYGTGTGGHIIAEVINKRTDTQLVHVPYRGEAPAVTDLLGGQISAVWGSMGSLSQHPEKMKVVAVSNPRRMTQFPDVPTLVELGLDLGTLSTWGGVFTSQKTPAAIAKRLAEEIDEVMAMPDVQQRMRDFGYEPLSQRRLPFSAVVNEQASAWKSAIEEAKIAIE